MSKKYLVKKNIILILNGEFPTHNQPLEVLNKAELIICCDGAANSLKEHNKIPDIIIGDLDSINTELLNSKNVEIIHIEDQNDNDLRKALKWISENMKIDKLSIIGSTGLREDHSIGNIASFLYKKYDFKIQILTDTGKFYIINESKNITTFKGQHISLFCIDETQKITTEGLKYKLKNSSINLYNATLNIAEKEQITINLKLDIPILIYLCYKNEKN